MLLLNKPDELENVKCYKCGAIFTVHPMTNINSPFIRECSLHNPKTCEYELIQTQGEPMKFEYRCKTCEKPHDKTL